MTTNKKTASSIPQKTAAAVKKPTSASKKPTTEVKRPTTAAKKPVEKVTKPAPIVAPVIEKELPSNPFIFEILNLVCNQKEDSKKIEILKKYEHDSLKAIFIWNYDDSVISALPDGPVPYSAVNEQTSFSGNLSDKIKDSVNKMEEISSNSLGFYDQGKSSIRKEYTAFFNFVKGGNDALSSMRRETMFINILEGLHPLEANILCLVKDKKLQTKYDISRDIISQAYPDIRWGNRS